MEFIVLFDDIKELWAKGYSAAGLYKKLLADGKITMSLRTFQKLCERHLKYGIDFYELRMGRKKKQASPLPSQRPPGLGSLLPAKPPEKAAPAIAANKLPDGGPVKIKSDPVSRQQRYENEN